nr:flagellar biosynthetic protein FliO [Thaumasiovibrio subtropicus]
MVSMPVFAAGPDLNIATTLLSLVMVIALIFLLAWLMKRMRLPQIAGHQGPLRVVKQLPLGQKERVVVVDVNGEQVLLGVTANNITLLKSLDTPLPEDSPPEFAKQFAKLMKKNETD